MAPAPLVPVDLPSDQAAAPATVALTGALDMVGASRATATLRGGLDGAPSAVIDLRGVSFMDVCGLRVLLDAGARADAAGQHLLVVRGPAHVDAVFTLTGTDVAFEIVDLPPTESPTEPRARTHGARAAARELAAPPAGCATSLQAFMRHVEETLAARAEARLRAWLDVVVSSPGPGHGTSRPRQDSVGNAA